MGAPPGSPINNNTVIQQTFYGVEDGEGCRFSDYTMNSYPYMASPTLSSVAIDIYFVLASL